jgi:hypothetical protein
MLRILISLGLLLMMIGFGAAGWQYWQARSAAEAALAEAEAEAAAPVAWLVSRSGGVVPRAETEAYLLQDRFVPSRVLELTLTAPLTALLMDGEALPDPAYLEVMADIRAPKLAEGLCPILTAAGAEACAMNAARVVAGSVDSARRTARFRIELVYRDGAAAGELPDLAAHVLDVATVPLDLAATPDAAQAVTGALSALASTARTACPEDTEGLCRTLRLTLDWSPEGPVTGSASVGWLAALPEGMFAAPPIEPAPPEG